MDAFCWYLILQVQLLTTQCYCNMLNFLPNFHNRHPIAQSWEQGMGWLSWEWTLIYVLRQSPQWCMQCKVIFNDLMTGSTIYRADSKFTPSQWEMALLCNVVSHWLGANLESAMQVVKLFTTICKQISHHMALLGHQQTWCCLKNS